MGSRSGRPPPPDSGAGRYIRSFLFERLVVGALGIVLPFSLVFIDWLVFHGHPVPRDSESAYYYSGMREWFTVTVGTCGFFFIAYRITESTLETTLSLFGGVAALLIAIFPTGRTKFEMTHGVMKTPLQKLLGEHHVADVHVVSAFVFIIAIGGISVLFGLAVRRGSRHANFWRMFHSVCAGVIGLALIWALATYHSGPGGRRSPPRLRAPSPSARPGSPPGRTSSTCSGGREWAHLGSKSARG